MHGSAQPDPLPPEEATLDGAHKFDESELQAALQLLVERAQYITGATGATLALPEGGEIVCRASVGASAPPVGARLQVRSGLTGESISRRQLLRCDNAENDPRVNLETCREMGIASIVVMPLVRRNGEVRGLFELFSDHAYAFEERDLSALERMADLTLTALDLAESRPPDNRPKEAAAAVPALQRTDAAAPAVPAIPVPAPLPDSAKIPSDEAAPASNALKAEPPAAEGVAVPHGVPEAMRRVQKCSSCGFPVSEGRTICLDCEKKRESPLPSSGPAPAEFVPAFLSSSPPPKESWLTDHVNLLAIVVLIVGIFVAIVVFR
ncbi:MAG TPA: GAF domain-containing protein [Candidatus Acidoferrum sp.]